MPTYTYHCEICQKEFDEFHSITDELDHCPKCREEGKEDRKPKRLISEGTNFILVGGKWASSGYS